MTDGARLVRTAGPETLPDRLDDLMRRYRVPGAQLAVHHDGRTTGLHAGLAEDGQPARVDAVTAFPTGSVTKAFTATLAMILVADGDLELDEPVGDELPELADPVGEVTLRHLLSHTAGLAADPDPADAAGTTSLRRHLADHCGPEHLILPPGRWFSYSNLGYLIVGRLVEAVTGMDFAEAMESILLRPLGIEPAFTDRPVRATTGRGLATGHAVRLAAGRTRPLRQGITPADAPAGALAASAADLVALGRLHLGAGVPDLLPAELAALMRTPVPGATPFGLADGWGLGLATYRAADGTTWVGHDGNGDGTSCHLRIDPAGGRIVAFTANGSTGGDLWADLAAELDRTGVPVGSVAAPGRACGTPAVLPAGTDDLVGAYRNGDVEFVVVPDAAGRLGLGVDGADPVRLTVHADLSFSHPHPETGAQVVGGRFVRDDRTGRVAGLQVGGRFAAARVPASV